MSDSSKNLRIKESLAASKQRRSDMVKKVFALKIDESHLSFKVRKALDDTFLQAKWLYNDILSHRDAFDRDGKLRAVTVKVFNPETQKCDIPEQRQITLGSQMIQSIIKRTQLNIINLAKAKAKGIKIGALDFAKEVNSIPLKQYGTTYKFSGKNHVILQKIGKVRVHGIQQLEGKELASAVLTRDATGYYIKVLTYSPKEISKTSGVIGLDFGIKDSIVTSEGEKFNWKFPIPEELKRKQRRFFKSKKGSKRRNKVANKVRKSYKKLVNRKVDATNKFLNFLKSYSVVAIQDENIRGWHAGLFGKQVQQSILGRIKSGIKKLETSKVIDRWIPTTKLSPVSRRLVELSLNDRLFIDGDYSEDRDVKAAKMILCIALYNSQITREELMGLPEEAWTSMMEGFILPSQVQLTIREAMML